MDIREAIEYIWENRKYRTDDPKTALSHLNEEVAESLKALLKDDELGAKKELEDAMSCLFIAMKVMEVDPVEAINNQIQQMATDKGKVMIVKKDKVEIYVNGTLKGGWSIWGEQDLKEAEKLAEEFKCKIEYQE